MALEILGLFGNRSQKGPPAETSGWRRFVADRSGSALPDGESDPEPHRPKRNYRRLALGTALFIVVVALSRIVARDASPLLLLAKENLPSATEQVQAVLAQIYRGETEQKRTAKLPEPSPRKRHHVSSEKKEEPPVAALPPYKGMVRAQLTLTPLHSLRAFQVELKDARSRKKMEVGESKALTVDIDDPKPATLRITSGAEPAEAPAAFSVYIDLSGPEADRVADVLQPTGSTAQSGPRAARSRQDENWVGLSAVIDKTGGAAQLRRLNGSAALAQAAIDTVRRMHYQPFIENGQPVEMETFITVEFTIQ